VKPHPEMKSETEPGRVVARSHQDERRFACRLCYDSHRWFHMIRKKLSTSLCLLTLSLQLYSSAVGCLEDCHSRVPRDPESVRQPSAPACSHAKAASGFALAAKSGCLCAIHAPQPLGTRNLVILDYSGSELSKLPAPVSDLYSKIVFGFLEARFHSPPSFPGATRHQTFLLNSNLRI